MVQSLRLSAADEPQPGRNSCPVVSKGLGLAQFLSHPEPHSLHFRVAIPLAVVLLFVLMGSQHRVGCSSLPPLGAVIVYAEKKSSTAFFSWHLWLDQGSANVFTLLNHLAERANTLLKYISAAVDKIKVENPSEDKYESVKDYDDNNLIMSKTGCVAAAIDKGFIFF